MPTALMATLIQKSLRATPEAPAAAFRTSRNGTGRARLPVAAAVRLGKQGISASSERHGSAPVPVVQAGPAPDGSRVLAEY